MSEKIEPDSELKCNIPVAGFPTGDKRECMVAPAHLLSETTTSFEKGDSVVDETTRTA